MTFEKASSDQRVRDLWNRGKFWEIFGFTSGDFTALGLAKQYSALTKVRRDQEDMRIIDDAFAVLNAPMTRQFYEGCRMVMQSVQKELGDSRFASVEDKIWSDLWGWVSPRWQSPPEELVHALKTKFRQTDAADSKTSERRNKRAESGESQKAADIESVVSAEAFAQKTRCQGCGKFDHTLRVVAFPYVISILIASFKRFGEPGIFCYRCRCTKSTKWAIVSLLFGWWSLWGFFWNIGALIDNFRGGKMPKESNKELVAKLVRAHMALGRIPEAQAASEDLLDYGPNEEASRLVQELDTAYPEFSPANVPRFRLGYLTVVFAILGMYTFAGIAMFGGTSTAPTTPSPIRPGPTSPMPTTSAPRTTPSPSLPSNRSALSTQITTNKARLSELETQIHAIDTELDGYKSRMDAILSRYPSRQAPEPYYSQYNDLVRQYNSRLASRNSLMKNYKDLLESTNTLIDQYNLTR
ncbi:MAG: hypothetical protein Q8O43_05835 [Dehalococcoidia bacterium]|nr:hypothetical protein [Dehalococcoidia bacterium]